MAVALITGLAGLIGSESVRFFSNKGFNIIGIDNDMGKLFFGEEASTEWSRKKLESETKLSFNHWSNESVFLIFHFMIISILLIKIVNPYYFKKYTHYEIHEEEKWKCVQ